MCYYTLADLCDKSHMAVHDAQVKSLPEQAWSIVQAGTPATRRAARHLPALLLIWSIALHAPLCCIIHCHIAPLIVTRSPVQQAPLFTCVFEYVTDTYPSLPPVSTLPPVVYAAIVTIPMLLIVFLMAVGWLIPVHHTYTHLLAPPPTPPPRSA
jgi:hypothetical protein